MSAPKKSSRLRRLWRRSDSSQPGQTSRSSTSEEQARTAEDSSLPHLTDLAESLPSPAGPSTPPTVTPTRSSDPHGLTPLHSPAGAPVADIIFIHGLGGSSRLTWCMGKNLDNFWPKRWLPHDVDLQHARIFTFGYDADFKSSAQSPSLGISDFAKNLLYDMTYYRDEERGGPRLGEVSVPERQKGLISHCLLDPDHLRRTFDGRACLQEGNQVLVICMGDQVRWSKTWALADLLIDHRHI